MSGARAAARASSCRRAGERRRGSRQGIAWSNDGRLAIGRTVCHRPCGVADTRRSVGVDAAQLPAHCEVAERRRCADALHLGRPRARHLVALAELGLDRSRRRRDLRERDEDRVGADVLGLRLGVRAASRARGRTRPQHDARQVDRLRRAGRLARPEPRSWVSPSCNAHGRSSPQRIPTTRRGRGAASTGRSGSSCREGAADGSAARLDGRVPDGAARRLRSLHPHARRLALDARQLARDRARHARAAGRTGS